MTRLLCRGAMSFLGRHRRTRTVWLSWCRSSQSLSPKNDISVAVAMSGGIDSAVTALLLKRQGYNITGIFMKNWDNPDEAGNNHQCPISQDYEDMKEVCAGLMIPALQVDFVREYWTHVFVPFVEAFQSNALTPNPDAGCNAHIKFDCFREHVLHGLGFDRMATGHYVRGGVGAVAPLIRGVDPSKDQSYFLATTAGSNFANVMFPLGGLTKSEVKRLAQEAPELRGLRVLAKRESMGICFVGKRKMADFLPQYFTPTPGRFVDIDSGQEVGQHSGSELFTIGQKAKIGGAAQKYYIAGKICEERAGEEWGAVAALALRGGGPLRRGDVLVAAGVDHPSLLSSVLETPLHAFNWVAGTVPDGIAGGGQAGTRVFQLQIRHLQRPRGCTLSVSRRISGGDMLIIKLCSEDEVGQGEGQGEGGSASRRQPPPLQAATPGQIVALYDGDTCLGGGVIHRAY